MSATGLEVFDRTIHKTNIWLKDLMETLNCEHRREARTSPSEQLFMRCETGTQSRKWPVSERNCLC